MKACYKVILLIGLACTAYSMADAQVYVGGTLTANTTWSSNQNPYIVVQNVIVPEGITLTILPGVILKFQQDSCIKVYGILIAQGTETNNILFTWNSTGFRWSGIKLFNAYTQLDDQGNYLSGTIISYCRLEGTSFSISIEDRSRVLIEKCELDNSSIGIYLKNSSNNIIRNCTIANSDFGIFIPSKDVSSFNRFSGNIFQDNSNVGFFMNNNEGHATNNIIIGNQFDNNPFGLYIGNDGLADKGNTIVRNNIISNSSISGLRLYQDSTEISENIFYDNFNGISVMASNYSRIENNLLFLNEEWGVIVTGDAGNNFIEANNIYGNMGGVLLTGQNGDSSHYNSIIRNAIHDNHGIAIRIEAAPQSRIQYNNFYSNGIENCFVNLTDVKIHAEYNWWGTTDTLLINKQIFDVFDNPTRGHVIYKPFAELPGYDPPISAPLNVVKRLIGNKVEVSWIPNQETDLAGYRFYFNYLSPYAFSDNVDVQNTTQYLIIGTSVFDTIAVTAYDSLADGNSDQLEGHESAFAYAIFGPYAGADTTICNDNAFEVSGATAFNYSSLSWTTSGDGVFSNNVALHPEYTPGMQDKANGQVTLTLTIHSEGIQITDEIQLILLPKPVAEAGSDATIVQDSAFYLAEGQASYFNSLHWTTSGDGLFDNENALKPNYYPGLSDINAGQVTLTLNVLSVCGSVSDYLTLNILPSYSISGKVHAGNMLMHQGALSLLSKSGNGYQKKRSGQIQPDGTFHIGTLTGDSLLIYITPDPVEYPDYMPTYYVGQLNWKDAFLLPLYANTHDLDIYLMPRHIFLPAGVGSISGICTSGGRSDIIPFADAQNLTIFLLDGKGRNNLGYAISSVDGTFVFPDLPYGDYYLQAEKAGFESLSSPLIQINPSFPDISGVQISLVPRKITIAYELPANHEKSEMSIYPNPASDYLHVTLPENILITCYSISDATGRLLSGFSDKVPSNGTSFEIDINSLEKGYYILNINDQASSYHCRFLKL